jgi:hypothetical protein
VVSPSANDASICNWWRQNKGYGNYWDGKADVVLLLILIGTLSTKLLFIDLGIDFKSFNALMRALIWLIPKPSKI